MNKARLIFALLLCLPLMSCTSTASEQTENVSLQKHQTLGLPVYVQIFKEERVLELYVKVQNKYQLLETYPICKFSGGLGPKQQQGDLKSPEGFYQATLNGLNPSSQYYKSINLGYPNSYDRAHGYSGNYLMVHGDCRSVGCYAMTDKYIHEIYAYVESALRRGQSSVEFGIYPFRMTAANMDRHRNSGYQAFWKELKPGYDYFEKNKVPPQVTVNNGQYVINRPLSFGAPTLDYALTEMK